MAEGGNTVERRREVGHGEGGYTLIELAVVVIVLGVLITLGVATYLNNTQRSQNTAAQSRARQAVLTQRTFFADRGEWGTAAQIQPDEPSIRFADLDPGQPKVLGKVYVKVDGDVATLVARSATGTCYWVRQPASAPATYATTSCSVTPTDTDFHSTW